MFQSYYQLNQAISSINEVIGGKPAHVQKIFSSAYLVCFGVRVPGETVYIYMGRGVKVEGLWITSKNIPSELRKQDKFLSYLRANLANSVLHRVYLDESDRAFVFEYQKWGKLNKFYFFYNKKPLNFMNYYYSEKKSNYLIFRGWENRPYVGEEPSFKDFDEFGRKELSKESRGKADHSGAEILEMESKLALSSQTSKAKKQSRKIKNISTDLERIRLHSKLSSYIESGIDLGDLPPKWKFEDLLKFNFRESDHYKRRGQIYEKVKSLKKAEELVSNRLDNEKKAASQKILVENNLKAVAPNWHRKGNKPNSKIINSDYKIFEFEGFKIGLGTSTTGNDSLRNEWASKNDWWFHLDGMTSAHAILKGDGIELDQDVFNLVTSLLLDYSKHDFLNANLIYTKVKDLKGVKGTPGKVIFKKEKRFYGTKINWRDLIDSDI